jgi:adenylylsulfate kinase
MESHVRTPAQRGGVVWLTGLSGAGKSTLATGIRDRLAGLPGRAVELLDGDELREHISKGLGFSREDRDTNVNRIAYVARLLAKHGVIVLAAVISPYADTRARIRARIEADGIPFVEVFVNAELATVTARDVKGLYKRALAGELASFTGVSDPYEAPVTPEVEVRTDTAPVEAGVDQVIAALATRGLL